MPRGNYIDWGFIGKTQVQTEVGREPEKKKDSDYTLTRREGGDSLSPRN